jgi:hypothetical protein
MDATITSKIKWKTPIPLITEHDEQQPYPIDCLPSIIKDPIISYQQYGQQPIPLIASGALANISLACQTLANVARDNLLVGPISLYFLNIASSGERKSHCDKAFSYGIRQWQLLTRARLMPEAASATIVHESWCAERDGLVRQIRKLSNNGENTFSLQQQLQEIITKEPVVPLLPELFFEDVTQEALVSHLAHGWPSSSLWSDEGGIVLSGHGMQSNATKFISTLNRLWDGNSFITHRKTSRSFTVTNRRLTVSLMLQPLLLEHMLKKSDGVTRQSGFLARSLITQPVSSMGVRFYKEPPETLDTLTAFHTRIKDCLDLSLTLDSRGCHELPILPFTPNAKIKWVSYFNELETGLSNSNQWLLIQDFASKAAENIARLSALFHLFTGKNGAIDSESVEQAIQVVHWHLLETKRVLEPSPEYHENKNAIKLLQWIKLKNLHLTVPRHLQQYSPIRDKLQRDKAIAILIEHNYINESIVNGKTVLSFHPSVFKK